MTGRIQTRRPLQRRADGLTPRANSARGKVRGALPRTPARGTPPETPAPFPFTASFQNGPRRPGCAPQNLFKTTKDFAPPRKNRVPWTAPGRSGDSSLRRERGPNAKSKPSSARRSLRLPLVGPVMFIRRSGRPSTVALTLKPRLCRALAYCTLKMVLTKGSTLKLLSLYTPSSQ